VEPLPTVKLPKTRWLLNVLSAEAETFAPSKSKSKTLLNKEIARAMRVETKTTISINDENPFALIHTTQQPLIQKLNSFCAKKYDNCIIDYKDDFTSIYTIPKEYVSIRHQQAISPLEETELNMIECQLTKAGRMTLIEYNVEYPYAVVYT